MTEAATILKMIEEVSPDDAAKLDEIDARVYLKVSELGHDLIKYHKGDYEDALEHALWHKHAKQYTRSLDALAAIAPKDWWFNLNQYGDLYSCNAFWQGDPDNVTIHTHDAFEVGKKKTARKSRPLVWLHAIIQAIEYERNK